MKLKEAVRERSKLARAIVSPAEILRGSLLERTIRHKKGCQTCANGGGHPAWVLSISYAGGRNKQIGIRPEEREQVERWLANYHKLKGQAGKYLRTESCCIAARGLTLGFFLASLNFIYMEENRECRRNRRNH